MAGAGATLSGVDPHTTRRALRDDVQLAGAASHVAVVHADRERTREDEEHLVGLGVAVSRELAVGADDPEVVVVEDGDGARRPWLRDLGEHGGEVDGRGHPHIVVRPTLGRHVT
jgi:hypothetical protein